MTSSRLLALAVRESRFARRRLLLFLSAISLGVAALVAVQGFAANLSRGVRAESRVLLGADVELSSRQPFGTGTQAVLDSLRGQGVEVARMTTFHSMALLARSGETRLVQVRAVDAGFPFYGAIRTRPEGRWGDLQRGRHALVDPALLAALRAREGDSLSIGETRFLIRGALENVPGDVEMASAFAPRVFIPSRHLEETGLTGFGSRVEHHAFLRLPDAAAVERVDSGYQSLWRGERVRVRTVEEQQERLGEAMGRLTSFLGLIGVFALLLGGIGVASAMGAYMAQKVDTVAVLRCLGATARQVLGIYLLQAAVMGVAGAGLGVLLGAGVQWVLPRLLAGMLPLEVEVGIDGLAVLTGLSVGVWTALVFALLPLLQVRRVSPLGALRRRVEPLRLPGRDLARWAAWGALAASVLLLVGLQVRDARAAAGLVLGIGATLLLLWLTTWALTSTLRRLRHRTLTYPLRQGLANLYRPGNQTRTVVLALGFGVFLLATLILVQHNLLLPLRTEGAATRANLLLWDVQDDQEEQIRGLLRQEGVPLLQRVPIVPMRIAAINGVAVRPGGGGEGANPEEAEGWALRREYRSTFRDSLTGSERLLAGRLWRPGDRVAREVSLEQDIAGDLGVELGDTIEWDVQGVRIPTVVTSLRQVDWARFEPNFFAVLPSSALEAAPKTWVMLTRAETLERRAELQREVVRRFSNVSVLDLTQVQAALDQVIGRISSVIRFLAAFSIATGFLVLLGAVSTSRLQRIRESVLLKTLGATRRQVGAILATEYLVLGLAAALAGTLLAVVAGWALARWYFDVPFELPPVSLASLGAIVVLLATVIGVWASREVFRRTPLEAIREE